MDLGALGEITKTATFEGDTDSAVNIVASALAVVHGDVRISSESSGVHANMACPSCLEKEGTIELSAKHLSVNLDRYLGLGPWKRRFGTYNPSLSALCMKEHKPYDVEELLRMPTLEKRGIKESLHRCRVTKNDPILEEDENGNLVPENPGVMLSLSQLPETHPALEYIRDRRFDPVRLENVLGCKYCVEEHPEDDALGRWYRRLPLGMRDTPQGRLIFYARIRGVRVSWQARLLDRMTEAGYEVWHPYQLRWALVKERLADGSLDFVPEIKEDVKKWKPSKYKTATGSARNKILIGFDSAVAYYGADVPRKNRTLFLSEGPLDAARLGPPAVAMLGKYLSEYQAMLITGAFGRVVYVYDDDKAGHASLKQVRGMLGGSCAFYATLMLGVRKGQDPGDAQQVIADAFVTKMLTKDF